MDIFKVHGTITPKEGKPELRFLCSARLPIVLYICVKFRKNNLDGFRVMERTRMMEALTDGRTFPRSGIYWVFSMLKKYPTVR